MSERKHYNVGKNNPMFGVAVNNSGCNNPNYKTGKFCNKYYCRDCGKKVSRYTCKRCQSCAVKYLFKIGKLNTKGKNNPCFGKIVSHQTKVKMSLSHGGDGIYKNIRINYCVDCGNKIDYRAKRCNSCSVKKQHKDNIFNYNRKPTKPELILEKILNSLFLKEYQYVGNNKVTLGGFSPDFINCNGQKKIIELFGCYWHKCPKCHFGNYRPVDKQKLITYKKYGYKTLIIWEHELKNINNLKQKILVFNKEK